MLFSSHVKKDLDPYVCLFEECGTPEELFSHSNDWLEHMRGHNLRWQCNSKSHGVQRFTSRDAYLAHIKEIHPSSYTGSQLDILADRSTRKIRRVFDSCPLCGKVDVNYDSLVAHVVGHLRLLAVKSLPPYEHDDDVYQPSDTDDASRGKSIPASEGERGGSDQMSIDTTILGSQGQDSQLNYDMNNSTFFVDESEFDGIPEHDRWKFEWGPILNFVQPDPLAFDPVIRNMTALASVRDRDNDPERRPADSSWYNPNHIAIQDMDPSSRWVDCMIKISSILSDTLENENSIMDLAHFRVAVLGDDYDWGSDVQFFGDKILHQRNFRTRDPSLKPMTFSNRGRITQAISMMCPQAGFLLAGLDSHYSASRGIILCTANSVSRAVRWATSHRASIICLPEAIERPELKKEATDLNNAVDEALDAGILIFSSTRNLREWDNRIYAVSAHHSECFRIGAFEDFSTTQPGLYFYNVDFLFPGYFLMQTDSADLGIKDLSFFERSGPSVATAFATGLAALILSCGPLFNSESSEGKWPQWATGDLPRQDMKDVFRAIGTGVESVHKFVEVWNFFDDVIAECEQAPSDQRTKILAQIPERLEARRLAFLFPDDMDEPESNFSHNSISAEPLGLISAPNYPGNPWGFGSLEPPWDMSNSAPINLPAYPAPEHNPPSSLIEPWGLESPEPPWDMSNSDLFNLPASQVYVPFSTTRHPFPKLVIPKQSPDHYENHPDFHETGKGDWSDDSDEETYPPSSKI